MQTETPEYEANKRLSDNVSKVCYTCSHLFSFCIVLKLGQFVLKLFFPVSKIFSYTQKMYS